MTRSSRRSALLSCLLVVASLAIPLSSSAHAAKARTFKVTAAWASSDVYTDERAVLKGTIAPVRRTKDVLIQEQTEEGWATVAKRPVSKKGEFKFTSTYELPGSHTLRAKMPKVGDIRSGASKGQDLTVTRNPVVTFTIPAGTAGSAWNTQETKVVAEVGQILRVINEDDGGHRLHATGAPFDHWPVDLAPGATGDYPLVEAFDGWLYDHDWNENAKFWITVTDPSTS